MIAFPNPKRVGGSTWPAYAWSFPIGDGQANVGYGELLRAGTPLSPGNSRYIRGMPTQPPRWPGQP